MVPSDIAPDNQPRTRLYPIMITIMVACLAMSVISAAEALIPGWSGRYVLIGIVITAIEAIYSFRVLRRPRSRGVSMLRYRLAEAFLLGMLMKIVTYLGRAGSDVRSEMMTMLREPSAFFSGDYVILLAAAWLTWSIINRTMSDFEALYDPTNADEEQLAPRENLTSRFYWGGGLLVLFIGVDYLAADPSRLSLPWSGHPNAHHNSDYHLNALLYFLLGTVILSQIQLISLMTGWRLQKMTIADDISKAWFRYGLMFLGLIILIVAVLPTSYSMGLLDTARLGLQALIDLTRRLMEVMIMIIALPLSWLFDLFGRNEGGALRPPPALDNLLPKAEPVSREPFSWEIIRAVMFWLTFVAVAIYLIRSYLEDHPELIEAFKQLTFASWLWHALAALMAALAAWSRKGRTWRTRLMGMMLKPVASDPSKPKSRWRWGRSRARSARAQVIQAYLQMLEYARAAGIHRQQHQTPYEYAPELHHAVSDVEDDIDALTDVFVHVRYSPDSIDMDHAAKAVTHADHVRRALRERQDRDVSESGS